MSWLSALRFGSPSHGGIILFAFGFLVCAFGIALMAAPATPDDIGAFGQVVGLYVFLFGVPPVAVSVAILRHHRWGQLGGILVGSLYGAILLSLGLAGSIEPIVLGILLFIATWSLIVAYRSREI
jgi:hypothetical protein